MTDAMRDRFEEFRDLGPNWDSYGGVPITPEAIEAGLRLYDAVGVKPWAVPTPDGGVQLEWRLDGFHFEAAVEPDGREWGYLYMDLGPTAAAAENLDGLDFSAVLTRARRFLAEREIAE